MSQQVDGIASGRFALRLELYCDSTRGAVEPSSTVLSTAGFICNSRDILAEKICAFHLGLACGRVAVTVRVSPSDLVGYRHRLSSFLATHNTALLSRVDDTLRTVPECTVFSRLYSTYHVMALKRRVVAMFRIYRLGTETEGEALFEEWSGGSEIELLAQLVQHHGPEPHCIPRTVRVEQFAKAKGLNPCTIPTAGTDAWFEASMAVLCLRYGPEPSPDTYLYPPILPFLDLPEEKNGPLFHGVRGGPPSVGDGIKYAGPVVRPEQSRQRSHSRDVSAMGDASVPDWYNHRPEPAPVAAGSPIHVASQQYLGETAKGFAGGVALIHDEDVNEATLHDQVAQSLKAANTRIIVVPDTIVAVMRRLDSYGISPHVVYYLSAARLSRLCEEVGVSQFEISRICDDQRRTLQRFTTQRFLDPSDAKEVTELMFAIAGDGLSPATCRCDGVTLIDNQIHEDIFAERCAKASESLRGKRVSQPAITSIPTKDTDVVPLIGPQDIPAIKFPSSLQHAVNMRLDRASLNKGRCCIALCEVLRGTVQDEASGTGPSAGYDCILEHRGSLGEALVFDNPLNVIIRALLHCTFDFSAVGCMERPDLSAKVLGGRQGSTARCATSTALHSPHHPAFRSTSAVDVEVHMAPPRLGPVTVTGEAELAEANRAFRRGDLNTARQVWLEVRERYPTTAVGCEAAGLLAEHCDQQPNEALRYYEESCHLDPTRPAPFVRCGHLYEVCERDFAAAMQAFDHAQTLGDETGRRRFDLLRRRRDLVGLASEWLNWEKELRQVREHIPHPRLPTVGRSTPRMGYY